MASTDQTFFFAWTAMWTIIITGALSMRYGSSDDVRKALKFGVGWSGEKWFELETLVWGLFFAMWMAATVKVIGLNNEGGYPQVTVNPQYEWFSYFSYTFAVVTGIILWITPRVTGFTSAIPYTLAGFFCAQSGINLYLTLSSDPSTGLGPQTYDIISATAQAIYVFAVIAWVMWSGDTYYEVDGSLIVNTPMMGMELLLGWASITLAVAQRFWVDPVRFFGFAVLAGLIPVVFALFNGGGQFTKWVHYMILAQAAYWTAFYAFPTFANASYNSNTIPSIYVLTTWTTMTSLDQIAVNYFFDISALIFTGLPSVVVLLYWSLGWSRKMVESAVGGNADFYDKLKV